MRSCPRCKTVFITGAQFCGVDGERLVESARDPLIGATIDRYTISEKLGAGGMACVYRARHDTIGKDFAIKLLYGEMASDKELVERMRREAKAASQIDHPNVVKVVDFGVSPEGLNYLVMELLEGRTLDRAILEEAPFPAARLADIVRQICVGLYEAHRQGFLHRDLKPSNVMLIKGEDGKELVKLLDFGLVQRWDAADDASKLTRTGITVGTPYYMAPERMRGEPATPQSDLYALGALLYEMLSGAPPFRGTLPEIIARQLTEKPPPLPSKTKLEPLAFKMLEREVKDRPKSAEQVIASIDKLDLIPHPVEAPPEVPPTVKQVIPKSTVKQYVPRDPASTGAFIQAAQVGWWDRRRWLVLVLVVIVFGFFAIELDRGGSHERLVEALGPVAQSIEEIQRLEEKADGRSTAPTAVAPVQPPIEEASVEISQTTTVTVEAPPVEAPPVEAPVESVAMATPISSSEPIETATIAENDEETELQQVLKAGEEEARASTSSEAAVQAEVIPSEVLTPPIPNRIVRTETKPTLPTRSAVREPKQQRLLSIDALDRAIRSSLRGRGLVIEDLAPLGRTSRLVRRWERAVKDKNQKEANDVGPALLAEIPKIPIDQRLLDRKLSRVQKALQRAGRGISERKMKSFQSQYKTLRTFLARKGLSDNDRRMIVFSAARLEREVSSATRGG
jgi:serine/threonine protein kinase